MSADTETPMTRNSTQKRLWPSVGTFALSVVLGVVTSMLLHAADPRGEIPDRIFANGFEKDELPYVPPELIESSATPPSGAFSFADQISIQFMPGSHDPGEIQLLVDEADVTSESVVAPEGDKMFRISYQRSPPIERRVFLVEARIGGASHIWVANAVNDVVFIPSQEGVLSVDGPQVIGLDFGGLSGRFDPDTVQFFLHGPGYFDGNLAEAAEDSIIGHSNVDDDEEPHSDEGEPDPDTDLYGTDITERALISESSIEYHPATPLPASDYFFAQFEARDRVVPTTIYRISWYFKVGARPKIIRREPAPQVLPFGSRPALRIYVDSSGHSITEHRLYYSGDETNLRPHVPVESQVERLSDGTYLITYAPEHEFIPLYSYCYTITVVNEIGIINEDYLDRTCFQIDAEWGRDVEILTPQQDTIVATDSIEVRVRGTALRGSMREIRIQGEVTSAMYDDTGPSVDYLYNFRKVVLRHGENLIDIEVDFDGVPERHTERRQLRVYFVPAPAVEIDTPEDWQSFGPAGPDGRSTPGDARNLTGTVQRPIRIEGRTSTAVQQVEINQQAAVVSPDGRSFHFEAFFFARRQQSHHGHGHGCGGA